MRVEYHYPRHRILFPYALFLLLPGAGFLFIISLGKPQTENEWIAFIVVVTFMTSLASVIAIWIINMLSTVILLDNSGITIKTLFRTQIYQWTDIKEITRSDDHSGIGGSVLPGNDVTIAFKDSRTMKIPFFVRRMSSVDRGIEDLVKVTSQFMDNAPAKD